VGGVFLGRGMMLFIAAVVEETYGVHVAVEALRVEPSWIALSLLAGVAAALLGAVVPAQAAAAVDPALALQRGRFQVAALAEQPRRRWAGLVLLALALLLPATSATPAAQFGGQACLVAGLTLLVPTFSHGLTSLLRRPMGWLFQMEGRLASDSLLRAPRRTSATVGALMFSLALVVSSAALSASVKTSMLRWVDSAVNPDLIVSASENLMARTFTFPEEMGEELRKVPGVRQVDALRMVALAGETRPPLLLSLEIDQYLARSTPILQQGRLQDLVPSMLDRDAAVVSANYARLRGVGKGDRIRLDTPSGPQAAEIVGVQVDYTSDSGTVLVDRRTFKRWWKDARVDAFELMLEKGSDVEAVRAEINRRFAGGRSVFVLTNADFRGEVLRLANQFWVLTYAQTLVALAVGVLGIVNSLTVSIAERRREIGILRALGGERRRVRRVVVLEAVLMGAVAVLLGTAVGATIGGYVIDTASAAVTGWTFPYTFPWAAIAVMAPAAALLCAAAAWYPSSLALRTTVVEALACE
jgi:putative ABC transport system permease protein